MASILKVDTIKKVDDSIPTVTDLGINVTGTVLQVKYFQLTTEQIETYGTSNNDQAITNFNIDITPKSTSSIIKLESNIAYECGSYAGDTMWFFFRNNLKLAATSAGDSQNYGISPGLLSFHNNNGVTMEFSTLTYFDTPSTTSAITYKLGVRAYGTNSFYINRTISSGTSAIYERGVSFISATEIAG